MSCRVCSKRGQAIVWFLFFFLFFLLLPPPTPPPSAYPLAYLPTHTGTQVQILTQVSGIQRSRPEGERERETEEGGRGVGIVKGVRDT